MRAKEYLRSLKNLNGKIKYLEFKLEMLETQAIGITGIDYSRDLVQTSPSEAPAIDSVITEITETKAKIKELQKEFDELKCKILICICRIDNRKHIELLTMRYLDFMSFKKIADKMLYTEQTIKNMHKEAMEAFEKANEKTIT